MSASNGVLVTDRDEEGVMPLDTLLKHIEAISALPALSSYPGGVSGCQGSMTIVDKGFILHAYFVDDEGIVDGTPVQFELYGPYPSGQEGQVEPGAEDNETSGYMTVECLKQVLTLLDEGKAPVEFVRSDAVQLDTDN